MDLDNTFNIPATKYGTVKISTEDVFINCPGSLNRKQLNDELWEELIISDHAIHISVPQSADYNVYSVSTDSKLPEYRLVVDSNLCEKYESKSKEDYVDTRVEYEGYIYVDPKLMICDPASFVTNGVITVDIIKQSVKDNESILCNFGEAPNNDCIVIFVFQIFDENDDTLEYRITNDKELAKKYAELLPENEVDSLTSDLEKTKI